MFSDSVHQFIMKDFHRICILAGLGRDRRTAQTWLEVALAHDVVERMRTRMPQKHALYQRGPRFDDYVKTEGEKQDETV